MLKPASLIVKGFRVYHSSKGVQQQVVIAGDKLLGLGYASPYKEAISYLVWRPPCTHYDIFAIFFITSGVLHVYRHTSRYTSWHNMALVKADLGEALPLIASGKVRELYDVDSNTLLFVATDRISAYDVIMQNVRPDCSRCSPQYPNKPLCRAFLKKDSSSP